MAKIYGLFGTMTGKLADTVMSVRNGEQIARKYQPIVFNPSTPAQVETRAKLKMMSQLSAVMAPVIAFPRQGSVSSRNFFVKKNWSAVTYENLTADITLTSVKLTESVVGFSTPVVTRPEGNIAASVTVVGHEVDKVVFVAVQRMNDNSLRLIGSNVVDVPEAATSVSTSFTALSGLLPAVVYAYGIRTNTERARTKFGDMKVLTAEMIASLIASRSLTASDVTLTETTATLAAPVEGRSEEKTATKKTQEH